MVVTLLGIVTVVRQHPLNAPALMVVTPSGIEMLVTQPLLLLGLANALGPIVVTGFPMMVDGMTKAPKGEPAQPVMVIEVPLSV